MKKKIVGVALIIIGVLVLAFSEIHFASAEKVAGLNSVQANLDNAQTIQWAPLIGMVMIVAGIVVIIRDKKMLFDIFSKKN